jgi:putative membrane protein
MLALVGVLQALFADAVLLYGLGIHVQSVPLFVLFSILTSWTFMALIQLLVTPMGNPGRYVAVLILILQLTACGGSYPVELLPTALRGLHSWLPMSYTLDGFRAVISSADYPVMWADAGILALAACVFLTLTMVYFMFQYKGEYGTRTEQEA